MNREEKIELLLKCRSGEIEGEDFLNQLQIPIYGYTKFLCYEILYWENPEEEIIKEMERASEPFFQKMIEDIENGTVIGQGNTLELLKQFGFQFADAYFPELAEKVKAKDPSVFGSVKMGPIVLMQNETEMNISNHILSPSNLEEFRTSLNSHPKENHELWFDGLANCLMNHLVLKFGRSVYRITECEFYYDDGDSHSDPYVHGGDQQLTSGEFYLNKVSGIDLTFGSDIPKIYGGILIRGVKNLKTKEFTNQVTKVTKKFIDGMGEVIFDDIKIKFYDVQNEYYVNNKKTVPIKSTRIGLSKKDSDVDDFINRHYRYMVELCNEHKFADRFKIVKRLFFKGEVSEKTVKEILNYIPKSE